MGTEIYLCMPPAIGHDHRHFNTCQYHVRRVKRDIACRQVCGREGARSALRYVYCAACRRKSIVKREHEPTTPSSNWVQAELNCLWVLRQFIKVPPTYFGYQCGCVHAYHGCDCVFICTSVLVIETTVHLEHHLCTHMVTMTLTGSS